MIRSRTSSPIPELEHKGDLGVVELAHIAERMYEKPLARLPAAMDPEGEATRMLGVESVT